MPWIRKFKSKCNLFARRNFGRFCWNLYNEKNISPINKKGFCGIYDLGRIKDDFRVTVILPVLAGFLAGIAGSMGLGGGSVLIIYLTVFAGVEQLAAQGINLIFFLPTAAVAVFVYSKKGIIKWRKILPVMVLGAVGTLITGFWVGQLKAALIKKIFGFVIAVYGAFELFRRGK